MHLVHLQDKLLHFLIHNFRPWFCITAPKQCAKTYLPYRHSFLTGLVSIMLIVKAEFAASSALQAYILGMIPVLLEAVEDEPVVAEDNAVMDHQKEPIMAADDVLVAPENDSLTAVGDSSMALENDTLKVVDNTLMAAVDTASAVVVVAIPMISLAQCQYFVELLYFGTGFDTEYIYKRYNVQNYSINHTKFCTSVHTCTKEVVSRNMSKSLGPIQLTELTTGYSGMAENYVPPILQP